MMLYTRAEERRKLKGWLASYYRCRQAHALLTDRLKANSGCEAPAVESRIREQAEEMQRRAVEIMDIISLLPAASAERTIMELRHIDCLTWSEVRAAVHLSRSPCYERYKRGLDVLLETNEVRSRLRLDAPN